MAAVTIGEILRQLADHHDNEQFKIELDSEKWINMQFTARIETDGSVLWAETSVKYEEE